MVQSYATEDETQEKWLKTLLGVPEDHSHTFKHWHASEIHGGSWSYTHLYSDSTTSSGPGRDYDYDGNDGDHDND